MSIRLYYDDPYLLEFRATVVSVTRGASCAVVLDRTAFYPTSGGQPCDLGWIGGCEVSDVSERDGEVVHTLRSCEGIEPGREVDCRVEPVRRRDHMQQHLGQHILSSAFEKILDASTVGFHLGPESVTIDLDIPSLDESRANRAEDLANKVVMQDRAANAVWLSRDEALRLPLRKAPEREGPLRIVIVEDFDCSPCGGTHPRRTGEVGVVKIVGWERAHAGVRVTFLSGDRALRDYRWKNATIADIARRFSVAPREVGEAVARQYDRAQALAKRVECLSAEVLDYEAASLIAESAGGVAESGAGATAGATA
ncbi:MAG: alanyl-tRNA editing protein, partial [Bacillota bacterium]